MKKIHDITEKSAAALAYAYKKLENAIVGSYKRIEKSAVTGYGKISDKCIELLFTGEGETLEEAKQRLSTEIN